MQASESSFVRKSAASMLSGKRPVSAAVSFCISYTCLFLVFWQEGWIFFDFGFYFAIFFPSRQPASKKGGPVKPSAKKDGSGKQETSKLTEAPEDVEVNLLSVYHGSVTFIGPDDKWS